VNCPQAWTGFVAAQLFDVCPATGIDGPQSVNPGTAHVPDGLRVQLLHRAQKPAPPWDHRWSQVDHTDACHRCGSYRSYLDCYGAASVMKK